MDYLRIGLISKPHGIQGAIKVMPLTDNVERFNDLSDAFVETYGKYEPVKVTDVSVQPNVTYMNISTCQTREAAELLRNSYICVDREHAVVLPEGRYFVIDLVGCNVSTSSGEQLGKLVEVYETGANDVYRIHGKRKLAVPALKRLLKDVNISEKQITLDSDVFAEVVLYED